VGWRGKFETGLPGEVLPESATGVRALRVLKIGEGDVFNNAMEFLNQSAPLMHFC